MLTQGLLMPMEGPFRQKEGLCQSERALCWLEKALLRPIQRPFNQTQEPLGSNKVPLRSKEGPFKLITGSIKPKKRASWSTQGLLRPKEGLSRAKDPGAGWPSGLGSRSLPAICRLRVRFPTPSGHVTLPTTGASVTVVCRME